MRVSNEYDTLSGDIITNLSIFHCCNTLTNQSPRIKNLWKTFNQQKHLCVCNNNLLHRKAHKTMYYFLLPLCYLLANGREKGKVLMLNTKEFLKEIMLHTFSILCVFNFELTKVFILSVLKLFKLFTHI